MMMQVIAYKKKKKLSGPRGFRFRRRNSTAARANFYAAMPRHLTATYTAAFSDLYKRCIYKRVGARTLGSTPKHIRSSLSLSLSVRSDIHLLYTGTREKSYIPISPRSLVETILASWPILFL